MVQAWSLFVYLCTENGCYMFEGNVRMSKIYVSCEIFAIVPKKMLVYSGADFMCPNIFLKVVDIF